MEFQTLRITDQGNQVKILQEMLNKAGGFNLTIDGLFGERTYSAVKNYQSAKGLSIDGIVGEKTWAALVGDIGKASLPGKPGPNWRSLGMLAAILIGMYVIFGKKRGD